MLTAAASWRCWVAAAARSRLTWLRRPPRPAGRRCKSSVSPVSTAVLASPNATAAETSWMRTFVGPNAVQWSLRSSPSRSATRRAAVRDRSAAARSKSAAAARASARCRPPRTDSRSGVALRAGAFEGAGRSGHQVASLGGVLAADEHVRQAERRHRGEQSGVRVLGGGHGPVPSGPRQPGLTDPAQHHRGRLIYLRPQGADRDSVRTGTGPRGGFHGADEARQDPAGLLVAGRLVGAVRSLDF